MERRSDREEMFRGCLLGGACGDALGAPVEFLTLDEIVRNYGTGGIRDFDHAYGRVGAITDDTQMTLFTAEGLIRAWVRGSEKGICHVPSVVHDAYLRWLETQDGVESTLAGSSDRSGWLIREPDLWAARAPGSPTLSFSS